MKVAVQGKTDLSLSKSFTSDRNFSLDFPGLVSKRQEVCF